MAAGEGEIQFPEPIIQRIQSFLDGKEAAQTTIVSKSWHSAWLTRPNLDFDDTYFGQFFYFSVDKLKNHAKKTIKRYEQSNLKIESFKLCMDVDRCGRAEFAKNLIVKALRIGATRLCLRLSTYSSFVLPDEVFGADNLVELSVSGCRIKLDDGVVIKCRRLESLSLYGITFCLGDLLSRFPYLKDFTLYIDITSKNIGTIFGEGIQISNCSLERIKLVLVRFQGYDEGEKPRVKFDVPSVRKLTFEGDVIPCMSFMSTTPPSRQWESHVTIECYNDNKDGFCFSTLWFNELSELLTELSRSKTHLSLKGFYKSSFDYKVGDKIIQGLRKHDLESLTIDMTNLPSFSCYALCDGLFRLCRPKLITQYYEDKGRYSHYFRNYSDMEKTKFDFLCQTLEEGINFKVSRPTQLMYGLNDLEEVNAQAFDMDSVPAVWKPIPFESLLDADAPEWHVQVNQRIRLLLKWKPS